MKLVPGALITRDTYDSCLSFCIYVLIIIWIASFFRSSCFIYVKKADNGVISLPPELKGVKTDIWTWDNIETFINKI